MVKVIKSVKTLECVWTHIQFGEVGEDLREAVVVVLLRELHLSHVKMSDAVDLVVFVDDCGSLPLSFR